MIVKPTEGGTFSRAWVGERLQVALDAAECDGCLARFEGTEAEHLRLAESTIVQSSVMVAGKIDVHVLAGDRQAWASITDLSDDGIRRAVARAVERARLSPPSATEELVGIAPRQPVAVADGRAWDPETAALSARAKESWLAPALAAHRNANLALAGRFHTGTGTLGVRSSTGIDVYHRGTFANCSFTALEPPAGHAASSYRARLDAAVSREVVTQMTTEVYEECRRAHDPVSVGLGEWDVVLSPVAVVELMDWMAYIGFNSQPFEDGLSFQCDRLGEPVTGESVTIHDDASMPAGIGVPQPFDAEGQPKKRVPLIEAGVARGVVHDRASARRAGCAPTGHSESGAMSSVGGVAGHLHFAPGEASADRLIAQVDRGLFITHLHYVNGLLEPRRAVMTGLTRDAAFLIEGGKLSRAITPLRFTDSILEAFGRIPGQGAVGATLEPHDSGWGSGCATAPALLVPKLKFTSAR